jgi:hypothetical protein
MRGKPAEYMSGSVSTLTKAAATQLDYSITAGVIRQSHPHTHPAAAAPAKFYIPNDETTPWVSSTNLASIITDTSGASLSNKYYPVVGWKCTSENDAECKLFFNKPSGSYNSSGAAIIDSAGFANWGAPSSFRGAATHTVKYVLYQNSPQTDWTIVDEQDISQVPINSTSSGVGGGAGTPQEFPDGTFRIFSSLDSTAKLAHDLSNVSTATTRTVVAQDAPMTHLTTTQYTDLTDAGDSTLHYHASDRLETNIIRAGVTTVSSATHTVVLANQVVHVTYTTTGAVTVTIDSDNAVNGRRFWIKDAGFNASVNNITVLTEGSETIEGETSGLMVLDGESWEIYSDGTNFFVR